MPELIIHVLNYRTPGLTIDCLRTLAKERESYSDFSVFLIDNASGDDSVPEIQAALDQEGWGEWVDFRPLEHNLGFAGGNNFALRECLEAANPPPFQLLLNSDTLVHEGCLKKSMDWMKGHPKCGAFSCMLRNSDGTVQNVCRKFPRPDRETARALGLPYFLPKLFSWAEQEDLGWDREKAKDRVVEWIGGAFMLVRTEAIQKVGVMDESFFFYGEDTEWCFRLRKRGWKVMFDPRPEITHLGGASSDSTRMLDKRKEILIWKARFHVQRQCYGGLAALWVRGVYIYAFALRTFWLRISGQKGTVKYGMIRHGLDTLTHPLDLENL